MELLGGNRFIDRFKGVPKQVQKKLLNLNRPDQELGQRSVQAEIQGNAALTEPGPDQATDDVDDLVDIREGFLPS